MYQMKAQDLCININQHRWMLSSGAVLLPKGMLATITSAP
jgi:hypothetical protein